MPPPGPVFACSFFAGSDLGIADLKAENSDQRGVPMGGELAALNSSPAFLVKAIKDPVGANLDRVQIIKGWIDKDGETHEKVYDVACSDGTTPDPETNRCADNGARVDLRDCSHSTDVGNDELKAWWIDPDFDPDHRAFYYARALQNPTCRWSTWDAIRSGVEPRPDIAKTLQERAWSSPIWVIPTDGKAHRAPVFADG